MNKTVAIVLAAGQGKRMNSNIHKQYLLMKEKPVLYYSLKAFQESFIEEIILVVGPGEVEYCKHEIVEQFEFTKVSKIIEGGKERYHSVYNGLLAAGPDTSYVFIHDGARPFIDDAILERAYECVQKEKACVVGMPVKDTIKIADKDGYVEHTPDRASVWMVQTPQVFEYPLVKSGYDTFIQEEQQGRTESVSITDDASVVEQYLHTAIKLVEGSYENIKITTPEDLTVAESFLK